MGGVDVSKLDLGPNLYIRRGLIAVGGDLVVGSLLSRIVFWYGSSGAGSRLRVQRDGHYWIAKTRSAWMEECSISEAEFRRAKAVLEKKGLIEVRAMKFSGVTQMHLRLIPEALQAALEGGQPIADSASWDLRNPPTDILLNQQNGNGENHQFFTQERTYIENNRENNSLGETLTHFAEAGSPAALPRAGGVDRQGNEEEVENSKVVKKGRERKMASARETVKAFQSRSHRSLPFKWKHLMGVTFPEQNHRVKNLTSKELGQLRAYERSLLQAGEDPFAVLDCIIPNWETFAKKAEALKNIHGHPLEPHIGFLLAHCDVAVRFFRQSIATPERPVIQPRQEPSVSKEKTAPAPKEEVYQPSEEEIAELFATLDGQ